MAKDVDAEPITYAGSMSCPSCHLAIPASKENFVLYLLADKALQCPSCEFGLDWWQLISKALSDGFLGAQYAPVGTHSTITEVMLIQGRHSQIDLQHLDIPESARILEINYTGRGDKKEPADADGTLAPLSMPSNNPYERIPPAEPIFLYPMPIGPSPPQKQPVSVMITWIDEGALSLSDSSLLGAVEALNSDRNADAVLSAAGAAEVSIDRALTDFFERTASPGAVERLMRMGIAEKADVLLPSVCATIGVPPLRRAPAEAFRSLRKLRNRAAHGGHLPTDTTDKQVANGVAGAVFAVAHAQLANDKLAAEPN